MIIVHVRPVVQPKSIEIPFDPKVSKRDWIPRTDPVQVQNTRMCQR